MPSYLFYHSVHHALTHILGYADHIIRFEQYGLLSTMTLRQLQVGLSVVFGAVLLGYLAGWFKEPSPLTSPLANEDLLSHVTLDKDLADFLEGFESPPGQYIVKV